MAVDKKLADAKRLEGISTISEEDYPAPAPDSTYEEKKTPGPVARGLSKALMQGAFQKFGEAFTDTGDVRQDAATRESRMAPYTMAGGEVASALESRWHTMEQDNFDNETTTPYTEQKKMMLDDFQRRMAMAAEGVFEGPDGQPFPVDVRSKEGRLQAVRMTNALTQRFFKLNEDMDLEYQNEVAKWESNPLIKQKGLNILAASSAVMTNSINPEGALDAADKMSMIRAREVEGEAAMMNARAQRERAVNEKPPKSYAQAMAHPNIGPGGIVQWLVGHPDGQAVMAAPGGGGTWVAAEKKLAEDAVAANNPDLDPTDPEFIAKVTARQPQWMLGGVLKFINKMNPADLEAVQAATPHFFKDKGPKEVGIVSEKRMPPKIREQKVDVWKGYAENHLKEYFESAGNSANIDDAMAELNDWLHAAIFGETDEPHLQGNTMARGAETRRLVEDILNDVPEHIRRNWSQISPVAAEENPDRAAITDRAYGGKGTRHSRRAARILERERKEKKDKGGLNLP